jgi:GST-like protein
MTTQRGGAEPPRLRLYAWPTPNAQKVSIMLEECAIPYEVVAVDINKGDQFAADFLAISPNNRIPAIIDPECGIALFESGAILVYLAERAGRLMADRYATLQWLMFQAGGLGPMCGQAHHFRQMADRQIPYAIARYTSEVGRLYGVMDRRLGEAPYLAGDYSIADIACWPWVRPHLRQGQSPDDFPNLKRWFEAVAARPAVQRGMALLKHQRGNRTLTPEARAILFGQR